MRGGRWDVGATSYSNCQSLISNFYYYRKAKYHCMTQHYELTYIVSIKFLDDELNKVSEKVEKMITAAGGRITARESLGRQKLAYPLKQVFQGTYLSVEFDLEGEQLKALDTALKLTSELLRHLIIKKKVRTAKEIEREKQVQERLRKEKETELNQMERAGQEKVKKLGAVEMKPVEQAPEVKASKDKVSLEELDKKLDEILTHDII